MAWASNSEVGDDYDIAGEPADVSLIEFAGQSKQSKLSVLIPTTPLSRFKTNPLHGRFSAERALGILLRGTGLSGAIDSAGSLTITMEAESVMDPRKSHLGTTSGLLGMLGALSQILGAGAAHAQTTGDAAAAEPLQEVTVTGSRVITNGNDSPTPVTVVRTDELMKLQPTTLVDALNDLPVFSGSKTQNSNPTGTGPTGGGNPSANQVNLRNLGLTSTLVLLDGQRVAPTLQTGTVDVDMMPEMLIQRVDVVTGGVSAVYGSDAIAGVVNYVIDRNFTGVKVEGQAGISNYGDAQTDKFGLAAGLAVLGGRGHVEASYEHYSDDGILARTDRPNLATWGVPGAGSTAAPYRLSNNLRTDTSTFGGMITTGPLKGYTFNSDGIATPFVNGTATGLSSVQVGGDGSYPNASLVAPEQFNNLFGRFDFDVTDTLHSHVQITFSDKTDFQNGGGFTITNDTLSSTNPFLSPALQTLLSAGGTTFKFSKAFPLGELPPLKSWAEEQVTELNGGLDGKIGRFDWGLDLNYGRSSLYNIQYNNVNLQSLAASLQAVVNPATSQVVCQVTLTNPTANPGCVPLNPFGPSAANSAAINYVTGNTSYTGVYDMYDANVHIAGDLFNTWAGPVKAALSAEWRQILFQSSTNAPPTQLQNCTGLPNNCNATGVLWQNTFAGSPLVHLTVTEPALELQVPLAKDRPLAKALTLNLAARAVSYSTSGSYYPWKIGPEWRITDDFTLRGTYSHDISAPTLFELFQPQTVVLVNNQDLLTQQTYTVPSINIGNPNLKAETADTKTLGFVWQPGGTGFSMTSDYYHIVVSHYIQQIQGFQNQYQQACYSSAGASPYCAFIERPSFTSTAPTNVVTGWLNYFVNIASLETWGDDLELNYAGKLLHRRFTLRLLTSYQPHILYTQPSNDTYDVGGATNGPVPVTASPSLRATAMAEIAVTDSVSFGLVERWRNPMKLTANVTGVYAGNVFVPNHVASVGYTDLNLAYEFKSSFGESELFLNIQNLLNTPPPPATFTINQTGPGPGYASSDDPIGRYFTVGLRAKL